MNRSQEYEAIMSLERVLDLYTTRNSVARTIANGLVKHGINTVQEAASHSDTALLHVRGIGPKNLDTIRVAALCESDVLEKQRFMVERLKDQREQCLKELSDMGQILDGLNQEIADAEGVLWKLEQEREQQ